MFILLCSASLFAQQDGNELYKDINNNFVFEYPDNWIVERYKEDVLIIYSPYEYDTDNEEEISQGIYLGIVDNWEDDLDDFYEFGFSLEDYIDFFYDYEPMTSPKKERINGLQTIGFESELYIDDRDDIIAIIHFVKINNRVIVFLGVFAQDHYQEIYEDIYIDIKHSTKTYMDWRMGKN